MAKAFSEHEQTIIKDSLIEHCRACWEKYGYRRTSIETLCKLSGISTGAFYLFFPSKEMLFVETANQFQKKLFATLRDGKPENPGKQDLAAGLMDVFRLLKDNKWVFSLRADSEIFLRKLPADFLEQDHQKDMLDIMAIVKLYELKPAVSAEEITAVVYTLFMSLYFTDVIGEYHEQALAVLIQHAVEALFE